jgi:hypothetical protein
MRSPLFLLLPAVLFVTSAPNACAVPSFTAPFRSYEAGAGAWGVATGDFDRDGHADLAVANRSDNTISVMLGDGAGSVRRKDDYPASIAPRGIIAADLNADGILDLVTSSNSSALTVLVGNGDGTFRPAAPVEVQGGSDARTVVVTDLNRDGRPDLVIASPGFAPGVRAALGRGDGSFFSTYYLRAGGQPVSVVASDLDGDGNPDIVVGDGNSPGAVTVLLGNGDGTVRAGSSVLETLNPKYLSLADLDGDGKLDLVVLASDFQLDGTFFVLKGNGHGSFVSPASFPAGHFVSGTFTLADRDGDSKLDLLVPCWGSSGLNIFAGHGDGTFGSMTSLLTEQEPQTVAIADLNEDGREDVVTANLNPGTVSVLLSNGDGTYGSNRQVEVGSSPLSLIARDLNLDGRIDLATANAGSSSVSVLRNAGEALFQRHDYATGPGAFALDAADLDGDARPDLAVVNRGSTLTILHGQGDGTFTQGSTAAIPPSANSLSIADLNRDGAPDVTVASGNSVFACIEEVEFAPPATSTADAPGAVATLLGDGSGAFSPKTTMAFGNPMDRVACGDLNGDGIPDMVATELKRRDFEPNRVFLALGHGDGTFEPPAEIAALRYAHAVAIADLDGNGIPDLVVGRSDPCATGGGDITLLLGRGGGTFDVTDSIPTPGTFDLAIGDLNGDGKADIASANISNTVSVLLGNGDGTFQPRITFGAGNRPTGVVIADVDNDGRMDLVVSNGNSHSLSVLLNTSGAPSRSARVFLTRGPRTVPVGVHAADLCVRIEPVAGAFELSSVDRAQVWLVSDGTGSVTRVPAVLSKRALADDSDGNGVPELEVCFGGEDLAALFSSVRGRGAVTATIEGRLVEGGTFRGTLSLTIVRTGEPTRAAVAPNPILGTGALTLSTERMGPVRVTLYDASGRLIRVIADLPATPAGEHSFELSRHGDADLPSGIYFYSIESLGPRQTGKLVIAK